MIQNLLSPSSTPPSHTTEHNAQINRNRRLPQLTLTWREKKDNNNREQRHPHVKMTNQLNLYQDFPLHKYIYILIHLSNWFLKLFLPCVYMCSKSVESIRNAFSTFHDWYIFHMIYRYTYIPKPKPTKNSVKAFDRYVCNIDHVFWLLHLFVFHHWPVWRMSFHLPCPSRFCNFVDVGIVLIRSNNQHQNIALLLHTVFHTHISRFHIP